ncbi:MAG: hypothetical protein CR986_02450 [Ignavibacteriae bacterium]|nr:MAG: hypothetical protein CR986_02450 [Ignavibacteriota bacterium]
MNNNKDLTEDNAGDILGEGQAWVGVNQFVNGGNGYKFLGTSESERFGAWQDDLGFSYYNDNYGMTNMYVTGEMAIDNMKLALFSTVGHFVKR